MHSGVKSIVPRAPEGLTENAGPENAGPQKQDRKMEDKLPKAIT